MMESQGYEILGQMPLRNLSDDAGNQYLCFTPILGRVTKQAQPGGVHLSGRLADQVRAPHLE